MARIEVGASASSLSHLAWRAPSPRETARARHGVLPAFCLLLALWLCSFAAAAVPRIGVMTMAPGEYFWERFGHNAIVVDDPDADTPISYNFGSFDPTEPGFIGRFVRGEMQYALVALPVQQDLETYRQEGRGVNVQWLDLDPAQAQALALALTENAKPENARYRYDYFTDNCSTRVRDAIDTALGGQLRGKLSASSHGNTYRSEATRLVKPATWMWLGFDIGFGPLADRAMSLWEEAFVPRRLADSLREIKRSDGRPLVQSEQEVLPHHLGPEPDESPRAWWPYALAGLAIAAAILAVGRCRPRAVVAVALPFWLLCALLGSLLLFLWGFTAHWSGWRNANALLLNPLCLLLLPGAWRILRGRDAGSLFRAVLAVVAAGAVLALFLHWLPVAPQQNLRWIALLLPVHVALLMAWWPRRRLAAAG
ncbi:uncharacterized protein DUF4105 [Luteimonas cucumeris]|uniref:Uncharacterized protein DUF4105 n=1 Tax=Luteimonas cucumeris TaxID=985012 RepID=A0A562KXX7_9GAMM|nr:DUF4105 domain-containing protein [Luteimonas cucumeris]TWI00245.1 uncharacterized protein DUF4105 [Luteimonas cucumeris]